MLFCAFLGDRTDEPAWRKTVTRHAAWLGLTVHLNSRPIADGRVFAFGWVSLHPPDLSALVHEKQNRLTLCAPQAFTPPDDALASRRGFETNVTQMQVSLETGEILIAAPVAAVAAFYYTGAARGHVFSDDLRLMVRWAGLDLDERAVYALFYYHAVPPTLTISRNVMQVPRGHLFRLCPGASAPTLKVFFQPPAPPPETHTPQSAETLFRDTLDGILARVPRSSVLSFSGGVDSGLLAARLAALGRKDVMLLHFSANPDEPEAQLALKMAAHLGLHCEPVVWDASAIAPALESLAQEHASLYGDPATIATMLLFSALSRRGEMPPMFLDGTGIGSIILPGTYVQKWRLTYALPQPARRLGAAAFRHFLWKRSSRLAWAASRAHKSLLGSCHRIETVAYVPLDHIAFDVPAEADEALDRILLSRFEVLGDGLPPLERVVIMWLQRLDNIVGRTLYPASRRGIRPAYPFLEPEVVRLCFSLSWHEKNRRGENKAPLKNLLAESIPTEWVYQPKRFFPVPFHETYAHPSMREFMREVVLSPDNPLLDFCHTSTLREFARRAETGQTLFPEVGRFLWTFVFASGWLQQLQAAL